jgi:hypothetical protein
MRMSEPLPPQGPAPVPPTSTGPTPPAKPGDDRGSLLLGIGLAWAIMIGGSMVAGPIHYTLWPLPPVAILVVAIMLMINGKTRTGQGMLLGLLSIVAVILLLIAACFGLLWSGGGFHAG